MYVTGCPLRFFCEYGDLVVYPQPLFAIGCEIPVQHIAFMTKLFQLGIHPGDLSFVEHFDGYSLCFGSF